MAGKTKNLVELMRPFTLVYPPLAVVCGAIIAIGAVTLNVFYGAVAAILLNASSNVFNQYFDVAIDRVNKPDRPMPQNKISNESCIGFGLYLMVVGVIFAYFASPQFLMIVIVAMLFVISYSAPPLRTKKRGLLANLTITIPRGLLPLVAGWATVASVLTLTPWLFGIVMALFVFGATSSKDFSDIRGDRMYNVKTLPVVYGLEKTARIIAPFLVFPFLLFVPYVQLGLLAQEFILLSGLSLIGFYAAYMLIRSPKEVALGKNHPSWKYMYILMALFTVGSALISVI